MAVRTKPGSAGARSARAVALVAGAAVLVAAGALVAATRSGSAATAAVGRADAPAPAADEASHAAARTAAETGSGPDAESSVRDGTHVVSARPRLRAELRGPAAVRTELRARVGVRLHPEPDDAATGWPLVDEADDARRVLEIEPAVPGTYGVSHGDVVWFRPEAWLPGTLYRVRVGGATRRGLDVGPAEFAFRTRMPEPERVEPGAGANVILSFDDGPGQGNQANELLAILAREQVRAMLFPTSDWTRKRPEWLARARRDGHLVCNHSETHPDLRALDDAALRREIAAGHGHDGGCDLLRPPLRGFDDRVAAVAHELGYRVFLWHVDTRDWQGFPAEDIENRVLREVRPGSVVLFHIQCDATLAALPKLVARLRAAGYVTSYDPADVAPGRFTLGSTSLEDRAAVGFSTALGLAPEPVAPRWWQSR